MKITTLIPAFKLQYLPEILRALSCQSVKPARVILSDDTANQEFAEALRQLRGAEFMKLFDLVVVAGPREGAAANFRHLLRIWAGSTELVHVMADDDVIYPDFYYWHADAQGQGFPCTVSRRWDGNAMGQPMGGLREPELVRASREPLISLRMPELFPTTVGRCINWFGEFSNAVFHRDMIPVLSEMRLGDISYTGLEDIGAFLAASEAAPLGFITKHLGMFRHSADHNTSNTMGRMAKLSHLGWIALALAGERLGHLSQEQATSAMATIGGVIVRKYAKEADMAPFCELIPRLARREPGSTDDFLQIWEPFAREPVVAVPVESSPLAQGQGL